MQSGMMLFGIPGVMNVASLNGLLIRSAQPTELGYHSLYDLHGVRTTINLDSDCMQGQAETAGLKFIFHHMLTYEEVEPDELDKIVEGIWLICTSGPQAVHFNCAQGCDRTGTVAAAIRIKHFGWSLLDAIEERDRMGFHHIWSHWLTPTIEDYADFLAGTKGKK